MSNLYVSFLERSNLREPNCEVVSSFEGVLYCDSISGEEIDGIALSNCRIGCLKPKRVRVLKFDLRTMRNLPFWYLFDLRLLELAEKLKRYLRSERSVKEAYCKETEFVMRGACSNYKEVDRLESNLSREFGIYEGVTHLIITRFYSPSL